MYNVALGKLKYCKSSSIREHHSRCRASQHQASILHSTLELSSSSFPSEYLSLFLGDIKKATAPISDKLLRPRADPGPGSIPKTRSSSSSSTSRSSSLSSSTTTTPLFESTSISALLCSPSLLRRLPLLRPRPKILSPEPNHRIPKGPPKNPFA